VTRKRAGASRPPGGMDRGAAGTMDRGVAGTMDCGVAAGVL
jgi:hypothetical protein